VPLLERLANQIIETHFGETGIEEIADTAIQNTPAYRGRENEIRESSRNAIQSKTFRQALRDILSKLFSTQDMEDLVIIYEIGEEHRKTLQEKMALIVRQEKGFLINLIVLSDKFEKASTMDHNLASTHDHLIDYLIAERLQKEETEKSTQAIMHVLPQFSDSEDKAKEYYHSLIHSNVYRKGLEGILTKSLSDQEIEDVLHYVEIETRRGKPEMENLYEKNRTALSHITVLLAKIINTNLRKRKI
jgi:hypothetical protein